MLLSCIFFWSFDLFSHLDHLFFFLVHLLCNKGFSPGQGNPHQCIVTLYVREGAKRDNATCSALCWFSVTSPTTNNQVGLFWCWFLGGWAVYRSNTLWVSPTNSSVRLGVSPAVASTPTGVFSPRFEALFLCTGALGCAVCFAPQLFLPVDRQWMWDHLLLQPLPCCESSLPQLPVSVPPTGLGECFFFISLVVGLPYSSIFCQFWLFFVFKLLLSFFWLCEEAQCVYLCLHLGQESPRLNVFFCLFVCFLSIILLFVFKASLKGTSVC